MSSFKTSPHAFLMRSFPRTQIYPCIKGAGAVEKSILLYNTKGYDSNDPATSRIDLERHASPHEATTIDRYRMIPTNTKHMHHIGISVEHRRIVATQRKQKSLSWETLLPVIKHNTCANASLTIYKR